MGGIRKVSLGTPVFSSILAGSCGGTVTGSDISRDTPVLIELRDNHACSASGEYAQVELGLHIGERRQESPDLGGTFVKSIESNKDALIPGSYPAKASKISLRLGCRALS